jgi:septum site-determining protein MinD
MGQLILITSGKGGSGKTTFAVNLAHIYASEGLRTLVLDLNQCLRNADIYMGLESDIIFDLGDVLSGVCRLEKAIVQDERCENLFLLCCPQQRNIEEYAGKRLPELYSRLRSDFDVVIIDPPTGFGDLFSAVAKGVDRAVTVITPDHQALRNGDTVDRRLEELGVRRRCFVVNRVVPELWGSEELPGLEEMTRTMRCRLAGVLTEDSGVHIGNNSGRPCASDHDSYLYGVFRNIALNADI